MNNIFQITNKINVIHQLRTSIKKTLLTERWGFYSNNHHINKHYNSSHFVYKWFVFFYCFWLFHKYNMNILVLKEWKICVQKSSNVTYQISWFTFITLLPLFTLLKKTRKWTEDENYSNKIIFSLWEKIFVINSNHVLPACNSVMFGLVSE